METWDECRMGLNTLGGVDFFGGGWVGGARL